MDGKFKRFKGSLNPLMHHKFKAKSLKCDKVVEYRIEILPEEHYEEAIELIFKHMTSEETFQKAIKISVLSS